MICELLAGLFQGGHLKDTHWVLYPYKTWGAGPKSRDAICSPLALAVRTDAAVAVPDK